MGPPASQEEDSEEIAENIRQLLVGKRISVGMEALLSVIHSTAMIDPICGARVVDQLEELADELRKTIGPSEWLSSRRSR